MRIYASKVRDVENPWEVRQVTIEHNHALNNDLSTYAVYRKLAPEDFEFACSMMRKGETPSVVLKVSQTVIYVCLFSAIRYRFNDTIFDNVFEIRIIGLIKCLMHTKIKSKDELSLLKVNGYSIVFIR